MSGSTAIELDRSIAAFETADDKKSGEKEVGAGKLVKLRAFNIFASKVRDTIKDENPVANGHELKRIAGQKWAQLDNGFKQEFIEIAQRENDLIEKLPVDPNAPKRRRRKRIKAEIKVGADSGQLPKKRGKHPEKDDGTNGKAGNDVLPGTEGQPRRRRMPKQGDAAGNAADPALSGTVDGSFGSGYLVTVRVGDTDMVFRGVLFEPYIAMPPGKANDLASGVKLARRNDGIVFPAAGRASSSKHITGAHRQPVARVNTEALKFIAQGVGAVVEVDRILPYTNADDSRLLPLLKRAKESFEMALELESSNTDAMLFLSRLHMYYHIPGTSPASGAVLLEAAADAGNPIAQFELACRLRAEGSILGIGNEGDGMDEKAFKYFELAACKKHPEALFLMGSIYLAGIHTQRNVKAASWCFKSAADQGHAAAATVYGALVAKGMLQSVTIQERLDSHPDTVDNANLDNIEQLAPENGDFVSSNMAASARHYFEVAAEAGDGLALEWLNRIPVTEDWLQDPRAVGDSSPEQHVTEDISQKKKLD